MRGTNLVNSLEQLSDYVSFSSKEMKKLKKITSIHPMQVISYYLSLIDWSNPDDPIRKMAIPSLNELNPKGSYDTSGEAENTKLQGLHKYSETALILATNRCATYCRYCFRKRLVGRRENSEIISDFKSAAQYIKNHEEINNVLIQVVILLCFPMRLLKVS